MAPVRSAGGAPASRRRGESNPAAAAVQDRGLAGAAGAAAGVAPAVGGERHGGGRHDRQQQPGAGTVEQLQRERREHRGEQPGEQLQQLRVAGDGGLPPAVGAGAAQREAGGEDGAGGQQRQQDVQVRGHRVSFRGRVEESAAAQRRIWSVRTRPV